MNKIHIFLVVSSLIIGSQLAYSQYIDVELLNDYSSLIVNDDPVPLDDMLSSLIIDHYGRRANGNVQSGIAQHGWGNTNVQGNVQQIRRQNTNAQTGVTQSGGNNNNVQTGVQQNADAPPPPPPPPPPPSSHIAAYLQSRSPYRIASHLDQ